MNLQTFFDLQQARAAFVPHYGYSGRPHHNPENRVGTGFGGARHGSPQGPGVMVYSPEMRAIIATTVMNPSEAGERSAGIA